MVVEASALAVCSVSRSSVIWTVVVVEARFNLMGERVVSRLASMTIRSAR
jgi:hypothetical protein